MEKMIKISVITPTYNAEKEIAKTIRSVIKQKYRNVEHIIVDGLSKDQTSIAVQNAASDAQNIFFYSEKDNGLYDAMNKGVEKATGEWCIFLGAGDTFCDNEVLLKIVDAIEQNNCAIIYGYVIVHKGEKSYPLIRKMDFQYTVRFLPVCHQAVFAKRELLLNEKFDIQYRIAADQEWILRNRRKKEKSAFVDVAVANYAYDGVSSSDEGNRIYMVEQDKIHRKYYPIRGAFISWYRSIKKSGE